jgi:2,4-dienoyl-CoA reductase-like NADH-dependent reductase (Old Yellow Enzyme family)
MNPLSPLFSPFQIRNLTLPNRLVISPMCNYSAVDGFANDWHLVTLGRYAQGGAGMVFVEATAVQANGRITHGDLGLWQDEQIDGLARVAAFIRSQGSVAAIQLGHAGRKASMQRPWFGNSALTEEDRARGDLPWAISAPSAEPVATGWLLPSELSLADIAQLHSDFVAATKRALIADFEVVELHAAHGYLLHSFLSPLSNFRTDQYGGDRAGRSRLLIELAQAMRAVWPDDLPLFVRLSTVDDLPDGWQIEDSVWLAAELKKVGVDVIDCSSSGIRGAATSAPASTGSSHTPVAPLAMSKRVPGFQVPWARAIKHGAGIPVMAVGLILTAAQAQSVIAKDDADLVAIGREALDDPNWPLHAAQALQADPQYSCWPVQFGWWLNMRQGILNKLGLHKTTQYRGAE